MTPKERLEFQKKLLGIKENFLKIGVENMPRKTINELMPKHLKGTDAVKWATVAINVWNGRSSDFKTYLPVFEKAYRVLKETEVKV